MPDSNGDNKKGISMLADVPIRLRLFLVVIVVFVDTSAKRLGQVVVFFFLSQYNLLVHSLFTHSAILLRT